MQDLLNSLPDKTEYKNTTSRKFKKDVIDFFQDKDVKVCLEIGTNHGHTTRVLSHLFEKVYTIDLHQSNIDEAKKLNSDRDNIIYITGDAYKDETYRNVEGVEVALIDCMHTYEGVSADISRVVTMTGDLGMYLIFDDFGHPMSTGVNKAVRDGIKRYNLTEETYVGEGPGFGYGVQGQIRRLINREGIIVSYGK